MISPITFVFVLLLAPFSFSDLLTADIEIEQFDLPTKSDIDPKISKKASFKYLADMYKYRMAQENREIRTRRNVVFDREALEKSEMVITSDGTVEISSEILEKDETWLTFNKTESFGNESIIKAELRVFQNGTDILENGDKDFLVTINRIVDSKNQEVVYVGSVNTTGNYTGWLSFDITSFSDIFDSEKKHRFTVSSAKIGGEKQSNKITLISEDRETRPFLVFYLGNQNQFQDKNIKSELESRLKLHISKHLDMKQNRTSKKCRLWRMYVNFKNVGWNDWIVAPLGYDANYCAGDCLYPFSKNTNFSNHAIVQGLMHNLYPYEIPKACCAPSKYKPINMIYIDHGGNVILKSHKDMVVSSCGCF